MAKISELPAVEQPTGSETVVVLDAGETKRVGMDLLASAAMAPHLVQVDEKVAAVAALAGTVNALGVTELKTNNPALDGVVAQTILDSDGRRRLVSMKEPGKPLKLYADTPNAYLGVAEKLGFTVTTCDDPIYPPWVHRIRDDKGRWRLIAAPGHFPHGSGTVVSDGSTAPLVVHNFVGHFMVGQSNGDGHGSISLMIPPGLAKQWNPDLGQIEEKLSDPFFRAQDGSRWPAFALAAWEVAKAGTYVAPSAKGGSSIIPGISGLGSWAPNGNLREEALGRFRDAIKAANDAKMPMIGWALHLDNGGSEADAYDAGDTRVSVQSFFEANKELIEFFRTQLGMPKLPVLITHNPIETKGREVIRDAQRLLTQQMDNVHIVSAAAFDFPRLNLMQGDGKHYIQAGYDIIGDTSARAGIHFAIGAL